MRGNSKYGFCAGTEGVANLSWNEALPDLVEGDNSEILATRQFPYRQIQAEVWKIDQRISAEAAAFAQIGKYRLVVRPALDRSAELAEGDDGHVQFSGQSFQRATDIADLLLAVFASSATTSAGHQLHVIDNYQVKAAFGIEPACLGADLHHGGARCVVDENIGAGQRVGGLDQDWPFLLVDLTHTQAMAVNGGFD